MYTHHEYVSSLRPMLESWKPEPIKITANRPGAIILERTQSGFSHELSPDNIVTKFVQPIPIGEPTSPSDSELYFEARVPVARYSDLLHASLLDTSTLIDNLSTSHPVAVRRIGIVGLVRIAPKRFPPGVARLYDYLRAPWTSTEHVNSMTLAEVHRGDGFRDRCHHSLDVQAESPGAATFSLDWQRVFDEPVAVRGDRRTIWHAAADAIKYFEQFATRTIP